MMTEWDIEKDRSRIREFEHEGRTFIITASDPYGFCTVSPASNQGRTPDMLKGQFTSYQDAEREIIKYVNSTKNSPKKESPEKRYKDRHPEETPQISSE